MGFNIPAGDGYQNQHVIPYASRDVTVLRVLRENGLFDIDDDVLNRLRLPTDNVLARASKRRVGEPTRPCIDGFHLSSLALGRDPANERGDGKRDRELQTGGKGRGPAATPDRDAAGGCRNAGEDGRE